MIASPETQLQMVQRALHYAYKDEPTRAVALVQAQLAAAVICKVVK